MTRKRSKWHKGRSPDKLHSRSRSRSRSRSGNDSDYSYIPSSSSSTFDSYRSSNSSMKSSLDKEEIQQYNCPICMDSLNDYPKEVQKLIISFQKDIENLPEDMLKEVNIKKSDIHPSIFPSQCSNSSKHFICKTCYDNWTKTKREENETPTCPLCRSDLLYNIEDELGNIVENETNSEELMRLADELLNRLNILKLSIEQFNQQYEHISKRHHQIRFHRRERIELFTGTLEEAINILLIHFENIRQRETFERSDIDRYIRTMEGIGHILQNTSTNPRNPIEILRYIWINFVTNLNCWVGSLRNREEEEGGKIKKSKKYPIRKRKETRRKKEKRRKKEMRKKKGTRRKKIKYNY